MLASTWAGFDPPSHPRFRALFTLVIVYLASILFSPLLFASRLVRLLPLSLLLRAIQLLFSLLWSQLLKLAVMVSLPALMVVISSWAWSQLFLTMSLLWQAKLSCQQMFEEIWQASYCPSNCDSFGYPFSNFTRYSYFTLSCDLDVSSIWCTSLLREYLCLFLS